MRYDATAKVGVVYWCGNTKQQTIDTTFNIIKIHHLSTSLFSLFLTSVQFFALHSHRLRRSMHDEHKCTCIRELITPVSKIQFAVCCGCTLDRRRRRKRRNRRRKITVSCSMGIVKKLATYMNSFPLSQSAIPRQSFKDGIAACAGPTANASPATADNIVRLFRKFICLTFTLSKN